MNNYRLHQIIASVSVAIFIMCTALLLLVCNRSVYEKTNKEYRDMISNTEAEYPEGEKPLTEFESSVNYNQIADEFTGFFGNDYKLVGYELSDTNIEKLKDLKAYYRWAWVFSISSLIVGIKSFVYLSKRRLYMPLVYGGIISAFITSILTFIMSVSKDGMMGYVRAMVFDRDYGFFSGKDIFVKIIPPEFANKLLIAYVLIVFILIVVMALIRGIIIYCGRPHKF